VENDPSASRIRYSFIPIFHRLRLTPTPEPGTRKFPALSRPAPRAGIAKPRIRRLLPILCLAPLLSASAGDGYLWPTNASRMMTSSFGEYRSSHLHAGLDIKTWGSEGWSVFAVDTGWVERIEVNPFSYGRCLRIRLLDGHTALYAHLSRFAEPIEDIVLLEERRAGKHDIALEFDPGFLPVRRGQTVAFTGQTGAGGPHLHFELWDAAGNALNPLAAGLSVEDRIAPTLRSVAFTPLDFGSHVDGAFTSRTVPLRRTGRGAWSWTRPVRCWGSVGVSYCSFDAADGCANRFSIYSAKLIVDGRTVFSSKYDCFPQALWREVHLDRDRGLDVAGRGLFQKLYVDDGNLLPFYEPAAFRSGVLCTWDASVGTPAGAPGCGPDAAPAGDADDAVLPGPLRLSPGRHEIRVETSDYAGNTAVASGPVETASLAASVPRVPFPATGWSGGIPGRSFPPATEIRREFGREGLLFRVRSAAPLPAAPRLDVRMNGWSNASVALIPESRCEFTGLLPYDEALTGTMISVLRFSSETGAERMRSDTVQVFCVTPEYGGVMVSPDGLCRIEFPPRSVPRAFWGMIRTEPASDKAPFGIGGSYTVEPAELVLRDRVRVRFDVAGAAGRENRTGVYARRRNGGWNFLGNDREEGWLSVWTSSLEPFTVLVDTVAPSLWGVSFGRKADLRRRTPDITVRFSDRLSGIRDEGEYEIRLDGERLLVEYDPERARASHRVEAPLAAGRHSLDIRLEDRSGNVSTFRREFMLP
jgi:hypothetical protein